MEKAHFLMRLQYVNWRNVSASPEEIYLICTERDGPSPSKKFCVPVRLGRGKFATVVAATDSPKIEADINLFALKFLADDPDSRSFSRNARARYFLELRENIRLRKHKGLLVRFEGCSRITEKTWAHTSPGHTDESDHAEESAFEFEYSAAMKRIDETAKPAEDGSMEDFFIDWRPWRARKVFEVHPGRRSDLKKAVDRDRRKVEDFFEAIENTSKLHRMQSANDRSVKRHLKGTHGGPTEYQGRPEDCGGLSLLNYIGNSLPSLRSRIVLKIWQRFVKTVHAIHSTDIGSENVPLAHRDLKLGNFLCSSRGTEDIKIMLTDLGFVAPTRNTAGTLDDCSLREAGMLALGSRSFRAPEQRDALPPVEVRFRVLSDPERNKIEFFDFGDNLYEPGDRLESPDIKFGLDRANRTTIRSVQRSDGSQSRVVATLESRVVSEQRAKDDDYLGFLAKLSGQHSDVFSLGSILYYLASGGKNPEDFYDSCLKTSINPKISEYCLSLALSLCDDEPANILNDSAAYKVCPGLTGKDWQSLWNERGRPGCSRSTSFWLPESSTFRSLNPSLNSSSGCPSTFPAALGAAPK